MLELIENKTSDLPLLRKNILDESQIAQNDKPKAGIRNTIKYDDHVPIVKDNCPIFKIKWREFT